MWIIIQIHDFCENAPWPCLKQIGTHQSFMSSSHPPFSCSSLSSVMSLSVWFPGASTHQALRCNLRVCAVSGCERWRVQQDERDNLMLWIKDQSLISLANLRVGNTSEGCKLISTDCLNFAHFYVPVFIRQPKSIYVETIDCDATARSKFNDPRVLYYLGFNSRFER